MHKARDYNNKEIFAYDPDARKGGQYFCLRCGARVSLRAKGSRKVVAHFGHLHGVANKEKCELYVESNYDSFHPSKPLFEWPLFDKPINPTKFQKESFISTQNLYLKNDEGNWKLFLVFKLMLWERKNSGHISISSHLGNYKIDSNVINLAKGKIKPLEIDFSFNEACLQKSGSVDVELWNQLTNNFNSINPINSIFNSPDGTGRKLGPQERLKKGQKYVYVSDIELGNSKNLEIFKESYKVNAVWIYPFEIKTTASDSEVEYLTSFFERSVVDSRPEFTLINLYPINVEVDGTYIIQPTTEFFCLQTESNELIVRSSKTFNKIERIDDKTVKYYLDGIDDFMIMWHNYPEIRFEKGPHQNKDNDGFKVIFNGIETNLLDGNKPVLTKFDIRFSDSNFDFKNAKVYVDGERKYPKLNDSMTVSSENLIVDAGCFGYLDSYNECKHYDNENKDRGENDQANLFKFLGLKLKRMHPNLDNNKINRQFENQRKYHLRKLKNPGGQYDLK